MPFLSSEQRMMAVRQHQDALRLLAKDEVALVERLCAVHELQRCHRYSVERIRQADEGMFDADTLQSIDDGARNTLMRGLTYYPVVIASGEGCVIKA